MAKKIEVSRSEMLHMREQGLSNKDIANVLEISVATVLRCVGPQGGRMESLAAFNEPKPKKVETPIEEEKPAPKAVDNLGVICERVRSGNGTFHAEIEYELEVVELLGSTISFGGLAELATFIIGLAGRINNR